MTTKHDAQVSLVSRAQTLMPANDHWARDRIGVPTQAGWAQIQADLEAAKETCQRRSDDLLTLGIDIWEHLNQPAPEVPSTEIEPDAPTA